MSIELQELVGGGQFPTGLTAPTVITGLTFRAAPGSGPLSDTIGNLNIYLSTSPNYPNTNGNAPNGMPKTLMSSTFANNVGQDNTLVFSGQNVTLSDAGCAGPAACPFDLNIVFDTPFYYGLSGPLLIDMQETNVSASGGSFDAVSSSAPGGNVAQVLECWVSRRALSRTWGTSYKSAIWARPRPAALPSPASSIRPAMSLLAYPTPGSRRVPSSPSTAAIWARLLWPSFHPAASNSLGGTR